MLGLGSCTYRQHERWSWTRTAGVAGQRSQRLTSPDDGRVTDRGLRCMSLPVRSGAAMHVFSSCDACLFQFPVRSGAAMHVFSSCDACLFQFCTQEHLCCQAYTDDAMTFHQGMRRRSARPFRPSESFAPLLLHSDLHSPRRGACPSASFGPRHGACPSAHRRGACPSAPSARGPSAPRAPVLRPRAAPVLRPVGDPTPDPESKTDGALRVLRHHW